MALSAAFRSSGAGARNHDPSKIAADESNKRRNGSADRSKQPRHTPTHQTLRALYVQHPVGYGGHLRSQTVTNRN